jgi:hypothetical protein
MTPNRGWYPASVKKSKSKVPENIKLDVQVRADALVKDVLKPRLIKPPPEDERFNYLVDLHTKWYRSYFYFNGTFRCPAPNCISEFFETKFARMEYVGNERFNLSYMRHTGQWNEIYHNLPLDQAMEVLIDAPHFFPV